MSEGATGTAECVVLGSAGAEQNHAGVALPTDCARCYTQVGHDIETFAGGASTQVPASPLGQ